MLRPWNSEPIIDCGESLKEIPKNLHLLEPHPYKKLGAPYGENGDPFRLRESVINRLLLAQKLLSNKNHGINLAIFDAWRPISVQKFMIDYSIKQECLARGIKYEANSKDEEIRKIVETVCRFWAPPSLNPLMPPPHSTGGAVDVTFIDAKNNELEMGGSIDEIGEVSEPDFYLWASRLDSSSNFNLFHSRRVLLASVMRKAGFVQHPNEWWHFSYGDQLWAWMTKSNSAIYGLCSFEGSKAIMT